MRAVEAVGAVLAGGGSVRMGSDKPRALLAGATLRDRALEVLDSVFDEVVLSVAVRTERGPVEEGPEDGSPVESGTVGTRSERSTVIDQFRGVGPLGGLEAVLSAAGGRSVFVLACDLPMVDATVVRRILAAAAATSGETAAAAIGRSRGRSQPLCGVYSAACLDTVRAHLRSGRLSMNELLASLEVTEVDLDDLEGDPLLNVNRPEDLERARSLVDV